jgi:HD-GYP domain
VRHHHERYDGKGYPDGIKGEEIPLEARIIAVADTYDAITSDRIYRKGRTHDEAIAELKRVAGTQLDPEIVEIFCKVVKSESSVRTVRTDQLQTA